MKSISGLDLRVLVNEFQVLVDSKLDKVFDRGKEEFLFRFHKAETGKLLLRVLVPSAAFLSRTLTENPSRPGGFCMLLRKRLGNARVIKVSQDGFERVFRINLSVKSGEYSLVFELFGKGNVILVQEGRIVAALNQKKWRDRSVLPGKGYIPPEPRPSLLDTDADVAGGIFSEESGKLAKVLAVRFGLGRNYAEYILKRAGLDPLQAQITGPAIGRNHLEKLKNAFSALLNADPDPVADPGKGIFFAFRDMAGFGEEAGGPGSQGLKSFASLSEAIDSIYYESRSVAEPQKPKKLVRIENMIRAQSEMIENFTKKISQNRSKAEAIYRNYQEIESLLRRISLLREKGVSWSLIKEEIEKEDSVVSFDLRSRKLLLEID